MSMVTQTARAVQLILDMLDASDQQLVLQQLNKEHALSIDVARVYSDSELADRYGVDVRTARKWIVSGQVRGFKNGTRWYSRADWIDEYERGLVS